MTIRYGSVCSGVEAATLAWHPLGWLPQWFCEFEDFPSAVLAQRWPEVPNLGDMTTIEEKEEFNDRTIDLLVGGTPCQSFSVAGLRKGLGDDRGNLALKFCEILLRKQPRWFLWENVPGVFSSNGGNDFANIIRGFQECGYSCAWRVLDAQYFGVPQRRRRVFVVGYLGDWRPATAVLFEQASLQWNTPPCRSEGESTATTSKGSLGSGKQVTGTIMANCGTKQFLGNQEAFSGDYHICFTQNDAGRDAAENIKPTLRAGSNGGVVNQAVAYGIQGNIIDRSHKNGGNGTGVTEELSGTLTTGDKYAVCYAEVGATLTTGFGGRGLDQEQIWNGNGAIVNHKVRRLTPLECERLQGFPDNHTLIDFPIHKGKNPKRKKLATDYAKYLMRGGNLTYEQVQTKVGDGHRYKACGNSMAVPVMAWLGKRIQMVDEIIKERQART